MPAHWILNTGRKELVIIFLFGMESMLFSSRQIPPVENQPSSSTRLPAAPPGTWLPTEINLLSLSGICWMRKSHLPWDNISLHTKKMKNPTRVGFFPRHGLCNLRPTAPADSVATAPSLHTQGVRSLLISIQYPMAKESRGFLWAGPPKPVEQHHSTG